MNIACWLLNVSDLIIILTFVESGGGGHQCWFGGANCSSNTATTRYCCNIDTQTRKQCLHPKNKVLIAEIGIVDVN